MPESDFFIMSLYVSFNHSIIVNSFSSHWGASVSNVQNVSTISLGNVYPIPSKSFDKTNNNSSIECLIHISGE